MDGRTFISHWRKLVFSTGSWLGLKWNPHFYFCSCSQHLMLSPFYQSPCHCAVAFTCNSRHVLYLTFSRCVILLCTKSYEGCSMAKSRPDYEEPALLCDPLKTQRWTEAPAQLPKTKKTLIPVIFILGHQTRATEPVGLDWRNIKYVIWYELLQTLQVPDY